MPLPATKGRFKHCEAGRGGGSGSGSSALASKALHFEKMQFLMVKMQDLVNIDSIFFANVYSVFKNVQI